MNSEKTAISILSISALVLLLALIFLPAKPAAAEVSIGNDDIVACNFPSTNGDALYILDNRAGALMVMVYDPNARGLTTRAILNLNNVFGR